MNNLVMACSCGLSFAMFYFSFVYSLPKVFMHFILKMMTKKFTRWNCVEHLSKRTHEHRNIVIPCPDLLYSTVAYDFSNDPTLALIFKAPSNEYASLGFYDDRAQCVGIASHPKQDLQVVVVGPNVKGSDNIILSSLDLDTQNYIVRKMPTDKGLLLHRLLIVNPSEDEQVRDLQTSSITCTLTKVSPLRQSELSVSKSGLFASLFKEASSYAYFPVAMPSATLLFAFSLQELLVMSVKEYSMQLLFILSFGICLGGVFAACTLKLLKIPKVVVRTKLMNLEKIGNWNFSSLNFNESPSSLLAKPFSDLIFFLHGALGLLPSEVYYGSSTTADVLSSSSAQESRCLLKNGGSYSIDVPVIDLDCAWWSITVYGSDLYLVPNDHGIYSVNSFQLRSSGNWSNKIKKSSSCRRIVCSPSKPAKFNDDDEIWLPMPHGDETDDSSSQSPPRFVLRAYLPRDEKSWCSDIKMKGILPRISELDS